MGCRDGGVMADREQIIEAGAKAAWEGRRDGYRRRGMRLGTWDDLPAKVKGWQREIAAEHLDAMEPLIRQAAEAEIAAEIANCGQGEPSALVKRFIAAERRRVAEDIAQHAVGTNFDDVHDDEEIRFGKVREAIGEIGGAA